MNLVACVLKEKESLRTIDQSERRPSAIPGENRVRGTGCNHGREEKGFVLFSWRNCRSLQKEIKHVLRIYLNFEMTFELE